MQFQRVIDNLLENALKYKDTDTVAMDIKLDTPNEFHLGSRFLSCPYRGYQ